MKILVKTKNGPNIRLWFPTKLIIHPRVIRLLIGALNQNETWKKTEFKIPPEKAEALAGEILRWEKKHPGWCLVDVRTGDGERVWISL